MGFIDIGARGGIHPVVGPVAARTAILGFEPDEDECTRMRSSQGELPWASFDLEPRALAGANGQHVFHILSRPVNSSLLKPSSTFASRYKIDGFKIEREVSVQATTLDSVLFGSRREEDYHGEFLKLDAQGAELSILQGATRTLSERTVAAIVEVEFCPLYEKQPLFSEVELFMRTQGFVFFGFSGMSYRSGRLRHMLDRPGARWRERLIHSDAVFFKDPFADAPVALRPSERGLHVLLVCAILLGYFDLAAEVATEALPDARQFRDMEMLIASYAGKTSAGSPFP